MGCTHKQSHSKALRLGIDTGRMVPRGDCIHRNVQWDVRRHRIMGWFGARGAVPHDGWGVVLACSPRPWAGRRLSAGKACGGRHLTSPPRTPRCSTPMRDLFFCRKGTDIDKTLVREASIVRLNGFEERTRL